MTCENCERLKRQLYGLLHPVSYEPPHDPVALNYLVNRNEGTTNVDYCGSHKDSLSLIVREGISVDYFSSAWKAKKGERFYLGDTDLIAAMRCYVGEYGSP